MMADCRRCLFFVLASQLGTGERARAEVWVARRRPGESLLGWCTKFKRPVTYYTGECSGFREKPVVNRKLTEFIKEG